MKSAILILTSLLPAIALHVSAQEKRNLSENFAFTSEYLLVTNEAGQKTKFRIDYFGHATGKAWQSGDNAVPAEGRFIDNRKCHWEIKGNIQRKVVADTAIGVEAEYKPLGRVYSIDNIGDVGPDSQLESLFYHRACNTKELQNFDRKYQAFKSSLSSAVPEVKDREMDALMEELKTAVNATNISVIEHSDSDN